MTTKDRIIRAVGEWRWRNWYAPRVEAAAQAAKAARCANWRYNGPFDAVRTAAEVQAADAARERELAAIAAEVRAY